MTAVSKSDTAEKSRPGGAAWRELSGELIEHVLVQAYALDVGFLFQPDIAPGNQAWYTFNKPLHGTTRETAREFIQPQAGTVDIYLAGEWCIFEGKACKAKRDTNFSPKDYPADWEVEE